MRKRKEFGETIEGKQFGKLIVIGDTGKLTPNNQRIFIARHIETNNIIETTYVSLKNGQTNGYKGSQRHLNQVNRDLTSEESKKRSKEKRLTNNTSTQTFQNIVRKNSKTGYNGVSYNRSHNRWFAEIEFKKKRNRKKFSDFKEAVLFVNNFRVNHINPLMTEGYMKYKKMTESQIEMNDYVLEKQKQIDIGIKKEKLKRKMINIKKAKTANGVRLKNGKWEATVSIDGKRKCLGRFPTEQQAKATRQKAVDEQIKILEKQLEEL